MVITSKKIKLPNAAFDSVFSNNSWETIIYACQNNIVPSTWNVGDQKTMVIGDTNYAIDIIGKNHDVYSSGGTAPLTFQMHDCYKTTYRANDTTNAAAGWVNGRLRLIDLPVILALMPNKVKESIREVEKYTYIGSGTTTGILDMSKDKLFLLSEIEAAGTKSFSPDGEGYQYEYYSSGNSRRKNLSGTATKWWLRSPYYSSQNNYSSSIPASYLCINDSSQYKALAQGANNYIGLSFAFCF